MKSVQFKEANLIIGKGQAEYLPLHAYVNPGVKECPTTICFELDKEELQQVAETGRIWLSILTFRQSFHPISMSCKKPENLTNPDPQKL